MGNLNTTFFDALDAAATWSAGVAFKRSKGLPLDKYSVFESKDLAIEYAEKRGAYAETPVSYPGQVIAVQEGTKMVAYVLNENADSTKLELQQIGIIPTGDGKTINVTEDGVISLLAADVQVDEKNEDGEATGNKVINAGAQLVLQADGTIKWVQPDTTTAEGQAQEIANLKSRIGDIEPIVIKPEEGAEPKPEENLWDALDAEAKRADEAEKALGKRVDDVNTALADYAKTADVNKTLEDYAKTADINKTLEDYAKTADINGELAKKADKTAYDQTVLDLTALENKVNAFLTGTGTEAALDSLQELIAYIDEHDGADLTEMIATLEGVVNKLTLGTYVDGEETKEYATVKAYVEAAIEALKIGDYAKAADLTTLAGKVEALEAKPFDTYATKTEVENVDKKFANYTTTSELEGQLNAKADASKVYTKQEIAELNHATKSEVEQAVEAEAKIARAAEKANADAIKAIKDSETIDSFADVVTALAGKQDKLAEGAYATESYVDTKVNTLANGAVAQAQAKADEASTEAKAAQKAADEAQADADTNALNIQEIEKELNGYGEGEQKVDGLITKVASNATRIATAEGKIDANTAEIAKNTTAAANAQSKANDAYTLAGTKTTMAEVEAKGYAAAETVNGELNSIKQRLTAEEQKADNDTTYAFENGTEGTFKVTPKDGQAQVVDTGAKAYADTAIATALAEAKKYADDNDADTKYGIVYDKDNKKIKLTNNVAETEIDATDFIKDGMIDSVELSEDGLKLVITWNADGNKDVTEIPLSGLVDVYTGVDGEQIKVEVSTDNKISASLKTSITDDIAKGVAAKTAIDGYGDIVTHNVNEFATAAQGRKADTAIQAVAAGVGLKVTPDTTDATKVTIDIDETVTFIFNGGNALGY